MDLLFEDYPNMHIMSESKTLNFDGLDVAFLPWICSGNYQESIDFINNTPAQVLIGHLELAGFEMYKGVVGNDHGFDAKLFEKFDVVMSGHFHHKSTKGNINYLGAPYEMTWSDYNDPRGFHVFDTETRELEFIRNPNEIYVKINYNDDNLFFDEVANGDYSAFTGKYVKVIVEKKSNSFLFETLIETLTKANPIDVSIVEDFTDISIIDANGDGVIDQADDTLAIIDKVVEGMEIDLQKPRLKSILREVYNEALASES